MKKNIGANKNDTVIVVTMYEIFPETPKGFVNQRSLALITAILKLVTRLKNAYSCAAS